MTHKQMRTAPSSARDAAGTRGLEKDLENHVEDSEQTIMQAVPHWLPIESAPKDGTHFLAFDPIADGSVVICWGDDEYAWCIAWDGEPNPDCTHWMPLPAPPSAVSKSDDLTKS